MPRGFVIDTSLTPNGEFYNSPEIRDAKQIENERRKKQREIERKVKNELENQKLKIN